MVNTSNRFERQASLVPQERLSQLQVTVIGVGAIGRQVVIQLASLGVSFLRLVDFDKVEPTNVTTQGYLSDDVGQAKVHAAAGAAQEIDPGIHIETVEDRYRPQMDVGDVVFCCVDSIEARGAIWRTAGSRVQFWCDGRMLGEVIRVLTAWDERSRTHYPTTLFDRSEATAGGCTSRGVIYTAAIAAGLMTHQFSRWLRKLPANYDHTFNLLADELTTLSSN